MHRSIIFIAHIIFQVSYETKGQILVEVEPIRYQLENIQYRAIRAKTEKQVVVLSRRVLTNEIEEGSTDEWDTVTSMAAFNATYRFYWGQIAGLIKALPASATTLSYPQQNKLTEQDETKVLLVLVLGLGTSITKSCFRLISTAPLKSFHYSL